MFERFATWVSNTVGRPIAFAASLGLTLVWVAAGPVMGFSNTWQLIANTTTTIITWLMIFLLQHTQNRDTKRIIDLLEEKNNDASD